MITLKTPKALGNLEWCVLHTQSDGSMDYEWFETRHDAMCYAEEYDTLEKGECLFVMHCERQSA